MTFIAKELSAWEGNPVELYLFTRGALRWPYTSANEEFVLSGETYAPTSLRRENIVEEQDVAKSELRLTVARDFPVATEYIQAPKTELMSLTVYRIHRDDTDEETAVIWKGRVLGVEWEGSTASILCEPIFTSLKRPGLRRKYQLQCPHALYGTSCKVSDASYLDVATVTSVLNNTVTAAIYATRPDGYYDGGYVVYDNTEKRFIVSHVGDTITLASVIFDLVGGEQLDTYPGCAHNLDDCRNKFSNVLNYGGWPYIPGKNPMGGAALF